MKRAYKKRCDINDISGRVFGKLTVIDLAPSDKNRGARWNCLCKCGSSIVVYGGHLRASMRVSCGCKAEEKIEETGINAIFSGYKRKARLRGKVFELSREQFKILILGDCNYCGISPSSELKRQKSRKIQIMYNGIDRKDPSKDYILENCVTCCWLCNVSKHNLTVDEWFAHIKRIVKWRKQIDL